MTAVIAILAVAALFALSAFFALRGGCDDCEGCGTRWFKEKHHGSHGHRP